MEKECKVYSPNSRYTIGSTLEIEEIALRTSIEQQEKNTKILPVQSLRQKRVFFFSSFFFFFLAKKIFNNINTKRYCIQK